MKNNDRLTYPQAVNAYYGEGIVPLFLKNLFYPIGITVTAMLIILIFDHDEFREDNKTIYMLMLISQTVCFMLFFHKNFERYSPGGKFLRTIKGGFDSYAKAITASTVIAAASIIFICTAAAVCGELGIVTLSNSGKTCLAMAFILLIYVGVTGFFRNIRNERIRGFLSGILYYIMIVTAIGVGAIEAIGKLPLAAYAVLAAAAVIIIPLSLIVHLKYYRKKCWDN